MTLKIDHDNYDILCLSNITPDTAIISDITCIVSSDSPRIYHANTISNAFAVQ